MQAEGSGGRDGCRGRLKFSVVIPIYNVSEIYLRRCLDSVAGQSYPYMEALLVIDGATDGSAQVCREYAAEDGRFLVYERPNMGAGSARNFAIGQACGDYIFFVDSDDYWIDCRLVEKAAVLLNESRADVLSFGYAEFFGEPEPSAVPLQGGISRREVRGRTASVALAHLLKAGRCDFSSSIITKCVRTELLRDSGIQFLEGVNCEDAHFTALLLVHAQSWDRLNERVYAVRRHTVSTSRAAANSRRVADSMAKVFDDLFGRCGLDGVGQEHERVLDFLASPYLYALGKLAASYDQEILDSLARYQFVLRYSSRPYVRMAGAFAGVFGLKRLVSVLRVYLMHSRRSHVKIERVKEV